MNKQIVGERTWGAWALASFGSFIVLEALACKGKYPTLSATLQRWLGIEPPARWGGPAPVIFAAAWVWLTLHVVRYQQRIDPTIEAEEIVRDAARRQRYDRTG